MPTLPLPHDTLLVRTWFGDADAWATLLAAARTPSPDGFLACLHVVDDPSYAGLDAEGLVADLPGDAELAILLVADQATLTRADLPVLVVDVLRVPGRCFRVVPTELWSVENNLSLANLDWEDFTGALDEEGVFRGF